MNNIITEKKRTLLIQFGELIKNASDHDLNMIYGLVMGFVLSKGNA